jgi:hypothetical protein
MNTAFAAWKNACGIWCIWNDKVFIIGDRADVWCPYREQ